MKLLGNDNYVIGKIHEELSSEFEFIKLYEPMNVRQSPDMRDWVKRHSTSSIVRVFIAYLKDPETAKAEENEFYFGFIDTHGNIYTLPKNHLLI